MSQIHAEAEGVVDAPPDQVYNFLADYREGHPRILPTEHFLDYRVVEGGKGAGTVITMRVKAGGRVRPFRMVVGEPAPGRVLEEHDAGSSLVTSFTITPEDGGQKSKVDITTEWQGSGGVGGFFERTFAPMALRRVYTKELRLLAAELGGNGTPAETSSR